MKPKIAVVFYSTYGTNHRIAEIVADTARQTGADVRLRRIEETAPEDVVEGQDKWREQLEKMKDIPIVDHDDLLWADGLFFSSPTRFGDVTSQMRAFIDTLGPLWQKGALVDKTFTAATSAETDHGGQESTLLALYTSAMHWGVIAVPPGYSDESQFESGNPYGFSTNAGEIPDETRPALEHQMRRLVQVTARLVSGNADAVKSAA